MIFSIEVHSIPNFVEKGSSVNWTITLNEDYEFDSYMITMGSEVITPVVNESVMTISIASVTAAISISIATTYVGVAEPEQPDVPDTPTPEEPTVDPNVLRYIQSDGNQYIKTGVIANSETEIELGWGKVDGYDYGSGEPGVDTNTANAAAILGSDWVTQGLFLLTQYGKFKFHNCESGTGSVGVFSNGLIDDYGTNGDNIVLRVKGRNLTVDGQTFTISKNNATPSAKEIRLFDCDGTNTARKAGTFKLYYCKIWNGGELVRDYVPYKQNDVIGLYDNVSNTFFANSGTGTFIGE